MEGQGLCDDYSTAVEQLELFAKNAQAPKSLLRCLLTLEEWEYEHVPTGHINVLERYDVTLELVCDLMLEHRVMFKAPAHSNDGGDGSVGDGDEASGTLAGEHSKASHPAGSIHELTIPHFSYSVESR